MRYLSLDQALNTSGWALFDGEKLIQYGTFKTKSTDPIEKRLGQIWAELSMIRNQYGFDYLFFEDIQKQQNAETYKKLAYTQATVLLWCYWSDNISYNYKILSPSHWRSILKEKYKKSFGKTRTEQKRAAQQLVKEVCGVSATEDESDAICIGLAGIYEYNKNKSAF